MFILIVCKWFADLESSVSHVRFEGKSKFALSNSGFLSLINIQSHLKDQERIAATAFSEWELVSDAD